MEIFRIILISLLSVLIFFSSIVTVTSDNKGESILTLLVPLLLSLIYIILN